MGHGQDTVLKAVSIFSIQQTRHGTWPTSTLEWCCAKHAECAMSTVAVFWSSDAGQMHDAEIEELTCLKQR